MTHFQSKFGEADCSVCGRRFRKKHPNHKFCHWECQTASAKGKCGERRASVSATAITDLDGCGYLAREQSDSRPKPKGRYVYAWFNDDSQLPFYVGKGVGGRAWKRHCDHDGRAMWCQQIRIASSGFRVVIVRENLTNEGAMLLESSLISFICQCGGIVANQVDPLCRQELPPLLLDVPLLLENEHGR